MRGDPPGKGGRRMYDLKSTPHARGSTCAFAGIDGSRRVYPACAGIHPVEDRGYEVLPGLPRMRGDPPSTVQVQRRTTCLPRVRGDPPASLNRLSSVLLSTPHARIHLEAGAINTKWRSTPHARDPPSGRVASLRAPESSACAGSHRPNHCRKPSKLRPTPACAGDPPCCDGNILFS